MTEKPKAPHFDEDVVGKKDKLVELLKRKSQIHDRIKEIYSVYNMPIDWMKRLPASTFRELHLPTVENEGAAINYFELRSKLREEHEKGTNELEKLESEISVSKFELLLAKIGCLQKKLDESE